MRSTLTLLLLAGGTMHAACAAPASADRVGTTRQAVVRGTPSTPARDAVIKLIMNGEVQCTGTLIAADLVLTARHCVAQVVGDGACATFGANLTPGALTVVVGANAADTQAPVAAGRQIFHDGVANTCGHDLALLALDRKIPGAMVAPIRLAQAAAGEATTILGYGDNERGTHGHLREERALAIGAVGPAQTAHRPATGAAIPFALPAGEIATGQGSCPGDSGGPLLDAQSRVLGVVSRGLGLACGADQATIFSAVSAHLPVIEQAALAVQATIQTEVSASPPPEAPAGPTADDLEEQAEDDDEDRDDRDDDDDDATTKKPKRGAGGFSPAMSSGCTAAPAAATSVFPSLVAAGVLLLGRSRRRLRGGR